MPRPTQPITVDEYGKETHPAFGVVVLSRVSSTPGASLFDSEIQHGSYVTLQVAPATRKRDLNRDWIYRGNRSLIEVAFSEAQWAAVVSSFGDGSGTPCTIQSTHEGMTPALPFEPRLALSHTETREAADRAFAHIKAAFKVVEEKPTKANLRALRAAIDNAPANVEFAATSLTEHTENVVQKARADVEAMVTAHAQTLGLSAADTPTFGALAAGEDA